MDEYRKFVEKEPGNGGRFLALMVFQLAGGAD